MIVTKPLCLAVAGALGDDDDDETLEKRSAGAIHQLAMSIPAKHAAQPILQTARAFAADAAVPAKRRAAILGLAMAAEGCCDVFEESLSLLLPLVYAACADSVQAVREAACIALGEFAQNLQPAIIAHYETVLPHIFMVRAANAARTHTHFFGRFARCTPAAACRHDDESLRTNLLSDTSSLTRSLFRGLTERHDALAARHTQTHTRHTMPDVTQ